LIGHLFRKATQSILGQMVFTLSQQVCALMWMPSLRNFNFFEDGQNKIPHRLVRDFI